MKAASATSSWLLHRKGSGLYYEVCYASAVFECIDPGTGPSSFATLCLSYINPPMARLEILHLEDFGVQDGSEVEEEASDADREECKDGQFVRLWRCACSCLHVKTGQEGRLLWENDHCWR